MKLSTMIDFYNTFNRDIFGGVLTPPRFRATRVSDTYGQYWFDGFRGRIDFNLRLISGMSHGRAVVYHEMIHQYIEEILGTEETDDHGPLYWSVYCYFILPRKNPGFYLAKEYSK